MALDDISTDKYCWYDAAEGNMSDYNEATSVDFGKGKQNTEKMIKYWNAKRYGEQNTDETHKDIWGQYKERWQKDGSYHQEQNGQHF